MEGRKSFFVLVFCLIVFCVAVSIHAQSLSFSRNLTLGVSGQDVSSLQTFLIQGGFLHVPSPTGYYGILTEAGVTLWQGTQGLPPTGYFGPLSRAKLQGTTQGGSSNGTAGSSSLFPRNLTVGTKGSDVSSLQGYLIESRFLAGVSSPTSYFGSLTQRAVASWQSTVSLPTTGFFGPLSRAALTSILQSQGGTGGSGGGSGSGGSNGSGGQGTNGNGTGGQGSGGTNGSGGSNGGQGTGSGQGTLGNGSGSVGNPSTPTNLQAFALSSSSVSLTWTPSTEQGGSIAGYDIYRNGDLIGTSASAGWVDTGLLPSFIYGYRVDAFDYQGVTSPKSDGVSISTLGGGIPSPLLTTTAAGEGSISSNPGGIDCGSLCSAPFKKGTIVVLQASPAGGNSFTGWGGACAGNDTFCLVTMSEATSVLATFTGAGGGGGGGQGSLILFVTPVGTGSGTITGGSINCGPTCYALMNQGDTITLTATPNQNSTFTGWLGACSGTSTTCTVTMNGNQNVMATFTSNGGGGGNTLPTIQSFSANPTSIPQGGTATLTWTTQGATAVSISTIGSVGLSGSLGIAPSQTTTYTLTASNGAGQASAQTTVTVGGGGGGGGTGGSGSFSDNFNTGNLDPRWTIDTGSAPGNISGVNNGSFSSANVDLSQGMLRMMLTQTGSSPVNSVGAEIRSVNTYGYGTYSWTYRTASTATSPNGVGSTVSGSVSGGFTFINNSQTEIDFETEGQNPNLIEMTNWKTSGAKQHTSYTLSHPEAAFHTYKFVWQPGEVDYYIDDTLVSTHTQNIPTAPAYILMNVWGTNSASMGGVATPGVTRSMYVSNISYTPLGEGTGGGGSGGGGGGTGSNCAGPWSATNPPPASCPLYSQNPNSITPKRLPSDVMSHLAAGGDTIAANAITDAGNINLANDVTIWATPGSDDLATPLYFSQSTDPYFKLSGCQYTPTISISSFHASANAPYTNPWRSDMSTCNDGNVRVWDQTTGAIAGGYKCINSISPPAPTIGSGGTQSNPGAFSVGTGCGAAKNAMTDQDWGNSNGWLNTQGAEGSANFAPMAGVLRGVELSSGQINHALILTVSCNGTYQGNSGVFPVGPSAGEWMCTHTANMPPNGALLFLDYSDAQIGAMNIPQWQKTLLAAMAHYGGYVSITDREAAVGASFQHESGLPYQLATGGVLTTTSKNGVSGIHVSGGTPDPVFSYLKNSQGMQCGGTSGTSDCKYTLPWFANIPLVNGTGVTDHIHMADPCVSLGLAGQPGGCVTGGGNGNGNSVTLSVSDSGTGSGSVTSNPSGINCGSQCSASYAIGTSVTLTATANANSTFAGWSGTCSGTGSCILNMNATKSVTATFNTSGGGGNGSALNYYVSPSGSDSNDGSQAHPWATLQHAASTALIGSAGTIIHFANGTYNISSYIQTQKSGLSDSARLVYQSDNKWGAKLNFTCGDQVCWIQEGDYVDVVGFEMTGTKSGGFEVGLDFGHPSDPKCNDSSYSHMGCEYGQFNRVLNNHIHDVGSALVSSDPACDGAPFSLGSGSHDAVVDGNWVNHNGAPGGGCNNGGGGMYGIYVAGYHSTITNNIFADNNIGIHLYHGPCQNVLTNNVVAHNYFGGIILGGWSSNTIGTPYCVAQTGDDYNSVNNNIVVRNGYGCGGGNSPHGAFAIELESTGGSAAHNTVNNNYLADNFNPSCKVDNSIFINSQYGGTPAPSESGNIDGGSSYSNIFASYKDDGTGDYHLAANSPAINAGTSDRCASSPGISPCEPTIDFDGISRPQGNAIDIGAYESNGGGGGGGSGGGFGNNCSGGPFSASNPPPANCYLYASSQNLFNDRLPSDIMSHLFQPQNYGISNFTGDQIARAALTSDGQIALNNEFSGGWAQWSSPAKDGTAGANDDSKPVYFSKTTDPWWEIQGSIGNDVILRVPTGAEYRHFASPGQGGDSEITIWDQDMGIFANIYAWLNNSYKWPAPSGGCGTSASNPCSATKLGIPGSGTGPYHSVGAAWIDPSVKDWGHGTGTYTATIKGVKEVLGDTCDNGNGGSPGSYCITWHSQQEQIIPHALMGGLECTNSQNPNVFPAVTTAYICNSADGLPHGGANMPPNGSLLFVDYTDAQINSMGLDTAQKVLLTALAHYGTYLQVTGGAGNGEAFQSISEGGQSGLAYFFETGKQDPFYSWLAGQKEGPASGGTAPQRAIYGSTGNNPPTSEYRLIINALYGLPLETCSGTGCTPTDMSGRSCTSGAGCDVSGHVHIADPCIVKRMAGLSGC